jgi:hypothetical protein
MFKKLSMMTFRGWLLNGWYYVRFYTLAYLTNYFDNPPVNPPAKDGYALTFSDEFNQPAIDWTACHSFRSTS